MEKYLFIGLGGAVGSVARYIVSRTIYNVSGATFPYGTLAVNVIGCLLIGFLMSFMQERLTVNSNYRFVLIIGFLGGFTTFSSFSFETFELMRSGSITASILNAAYNLGGCLIATWGGYVVGKNLL